ncbi:hypothetical protein ACFVYT_29160 [Streptomyces sp. NPDC058290]|uniref:hypothetical protein n=1 Tax=Streptomyces sp. NPDC058290 TaxID=3346426 RepID=UPI0036EBE8C4
MGRWSLPLLLAALLAASGCVTIHSTPARQGLVRRGPGGPQAACRPPARKNAAQALTDDLGTRIEELQARLREAETHLEHLAITRKTIIALADRIPAQADSPDLPEHPDYPRILTVFNEATGPLRTRDVCQTLDHELLPKNIEGTRAKLKRLVKVDILTEDDVGSFTTRKRAQFANRPAPDVRAAGGERYRAPLDGARKPATIWCAY